jgi:hypothetical protein
VSEQQQDYAETDMDEAAREYDEGKASRGLKTTKLKEGKNVGRIGPPRPGNKLPFTKFWVHGVGEGTNFRSFQCPDKHLGQPCSCCDEVSRLFRTGNTLDREQANKMRVKVEAYCNWLDMADIAAGWQPLRLAEGTYMDLLALMKGSPALDEPACNYSHPVTGRNVIIDRQGTGKQTRYKCSLGASGAKPIPPGVSLADMKDLSQAVRAIAAEQVAGLLSGGQSSPDRQLAGSPEDGISGSQAGSIADDPDLIA